MKRVPIVVACLASVTVLSSVQGQSLEERIKMVREQRNRAAQQVQAVEVETQQIPKKLGTVIDEVFFDQTPARDVFNWWSQVTDIPLVIDWEGMALDGVDAEQGITLNLQTVPAKQLLRIMMQQAAPQTDLVYEVTPWYLQIMTKRQANRNPVLKVYEVSDMVMTIPNFTNAPRIDLSEALDSSGSGGGGSGGGGGGGRGGGSGGGLFGDEDQDDQEDQKTKNERGQDLADLIRETIEPDIWVANGGEVASVRYYDGRLIVNAPMYVHRQIEIPTVSGDRAGDGLSTGYQSPAGGVNSPSVQEPFGKAKR